MLQPKRFIFGARKRSIGGDYFIGEIVFLGGISISVLGLGGFFLVPFGIKISVLGCGIILFKIGWICACLRPYGSS